MEVYVYQFLGCLWTSTHAFMNVSEQFFKQLDSFHQILCQLFVIKAIIPC
jgi:hypothetical protein